MTTFRSPRPCPRPSLPMLAATTVALPALVLSSLVLAQPATAGPHAIPASLAAAVRAQAQVEAGGSLASAVIPAGYLSAAVPASFRPTQAPAAADYTIVRGDTISGIAGKFGLDTYEVLKLNNLQANTIIYPGQKIKLGGTAPAPAAQPVAPAAPPATAGSVYTVKSGDTLGAIAAGHGIALSEVFGWNGLNMGSIIYPGQKIKVGAGAAVPAPAAPASAPAAPAPATAGSGSYTVKAGDTLWGIATQNGVRLADILSANRLAVTSIIYPGNKLVIPGKSGPSIAPASTPPATVTPLVPSTFLGYTYPAAVVSSANQNKALLNASPVPTRAQMTSIVTDTARRMGVDPSLAKAFAYQESGFDQRAVSPANAIGTMQVIPSSGEWASDLVGRKLNLLDPYDNVTAGVAIIRQLTRSSTDLDTAIAGYYQGQYSVATYGMFDDTKNYVASVKAHQLSFG
ncbi:MAG: LysM peptidoglycan-binding protein [Arthrobacter sp.]|nr:LysM peptidoglycan-binding protein [Arthrobacter sp.]